jgi:hypothetical protein
MSSWNCQSRLIITFLKEKISKNSLSTKNMLLKNNFWSYSISRGSVEETPTKGAVYSKASTAWLQYTVDLNFEHGARDIRMVGRRWQENIGIFEKNQEALAEMSENGKIRLKNDRRQQSTENRTMKASINKKQNMNLKQLRFERKRQ